MSRALKQPEIDSAIGFVTKITVPAALCLHPVLGAQPCRQQGDRQAAHEKGDKDEGSLFKVHDDAS